MLHDLSRTMDAQNAEGAIQWGDNTHLYIYTDFVYFHDDIFDWKRDDAKIMCDLDYCNAREAYSLIGNPPSTCANEVVLPGESKTELSTNQLCQIVEDLNKKFVRKHMVVSTDEVLESLKCKTKLMNYRIQKACGVNKPFVELDDVSLRSATWKPDVKRCENDIEVKITFLYSGIITVLQITLPAEVARKINSDGTVIFSKSNPDQCISGSEQYTSETGLQFYYSEEGWILVSGREYFHVTRETAKNTKAAKAAINCCPEEIANKGDYLEDGFIIGPHARPYWG